MSSGRFTIGKEAAMADEPGAKPEPTDEEDLGEGGRRALASERKARREAEARVRELEGKVAEHERRDTLHQVAASMDVPPQLWGRIQGTTAEEMKADAQELMKLVGAKPAAGGTGKPQEALRPGASPGDEPTESAAAIADQVLK
jgi:hypothetical protein